MDNMNGMDHTDGGHNHMDMGTTMGMDHNMHQPNTGGGHHGGAVAYFHFSYEAVILFMQWATTDWKTMLYACIGIGVVAALYEGLKFMREYLLHKGKRRNAYTKSCCTLFCTGMHLLQTVLHIVQVAVSYALMLVFMTFNGWLCIAVLAGAGLGYLIFGWKRHSMDVTEHCN